jgi:predicted ribosomally synthesized peptide with nif11-like leader
MSEEQLKAFLEKVKADTSLQEKLKAAANADAVAAIAKEAGFSISADDLTKGQSELSEEEVEGVAGGGRKTIWGFGDDGSPCFKPCNSSHRRSAELGGGYW